MLNILVLVVGALAGFVGSRRLRHPQGAAQAASVARSVSGSLGRRKGLTPPELQRACFSEMVRHVRVTRQGRTLAPARYVLHLHPDDLDVVDEARRWFTEGLSDALRQAARANDWVLDGAIAIEYRADAARHPGVPSALAVPPDQPEQAAPVAPPPTPGRTASADPSRSRGLALVRTDTDEQIPLVADALTIGRSRDRDITIDDTRVSRNHARIEPRQGTWTIVDEGSANGTRLRGETVPPHTPRPLRPGDIVGIGPVDLRVTTTALPAGGEPGTRALDDSDRNRISGQVLPPARRHEP